MKIVHIDTEMEWRGGQRQAAYLHKYLHENGYSTVLICQPGSEFEKYCKSNGLPHKALNMRSEFDIIAGYKIARFCKDIGGQILHLHSGHALAVGLWAGIFCRKIKLIAVRRVDFHIKKNILSRIKYRNYLLDKIICVSDSVRRVLIEDGIDERKLVTIHSGIDLNKFNGNSKYKGLKKELGIPENNILVGTVAAIVGHKDYQNLINAASIVLKKNRNVTFCAYGTGVLEEKMREFVRYLGIEKNFIFAGFRRDVEDFLKNCDLFVLASKKEGLGTSILDAQSFGLPVIACRTGGIPEAVTDGDNGLLVEPQNSQQLAKAIIKLLDNGSKREELGRKAFETVRNFDIRKTINGNIELYQELMDN
ncbi:MAG: glycosyltransferase family 4 protein [Candidatus Krumholzibacteriota bacterium]|nr:glycosyltransferase family 4 protein [Candidatus Krumholzibacteriota bacterium]